MADAEFEAYRAYRYVVWNFLYAIGFWPKKKSNIFYSALPYIHVSFCAFSIFGMYGFFQKYIANVILMTSGLCVMLSVGTVVIKVLCLLYTNEDVNYLRESLDPYFNNLTNNPKLRPVVLKDVAMFHRLAMSVVLSVVIVCGFYSSGPVIYLIIQYAKHSPEMKYILPYPGVFPWEIPPNTFIYWVHYVVEALATTSSCWVASSVDSAYTFQVFQMIGLLREISYNLLNISDKKNYDAVIQDCIDKYEVILKCRDKVQRIYGPVVLWTMISNGIIMCAVIFQLTHMNAISIEQIILFTFYAFFKISQTFVYAWAGTRLTTESENFRETIYTINWVGNKKLMSALVIMLTQQPLTLTACNFSIVSVNMFVAIMNTTISYFFLLQTMDESK